MDSAALLDISPDKKVVLPTVVWAPRRRRQRRLHPDKRSAGPGQYPFQSDNSTVRHSTHILAAPSYSMVRTPNSIGECHTTRVENGLVFRDRTYGSICMRESSSIFETSELFTSALVPQKPGKLRDRLPWRASELRGCL